MHIIPAHLADDGIRRGIGAVGDDADDLFRKRQFRRHQNRSGAHGDTDEKDLCLRPETLYGIVEPVQTVIPLLNAEGDGMAGAPALCPLFDRQEVVPLPAYDLRSAAEVPRRGPAVTMEADIQRCAVLLMVVLCMEFQIVMRADDDRLIRNCPDIVDHLQNPVPQRIQLRSVHDSVIVVLRFVRRMEREAVDPVTYRQKEKDQSEKNIQNNHGIIPDQTKISAVTNCLPFRELPPRAPTTAFPCPRIEMTSPSCTGVSGFKQTL